MSTTEPSPDGLRPPPPPAFASPPPAILSLTRFPLSVVLSYLTETDGVSTLLAHRAWSNNVLPMFRLPDRLSVASSSSSSAGEEDGGVPRKKRRRRHRFVVVPCQDPAVLLARVNARRLARRILRSGSRAAGDENGEGGGGPHRYRRGLTTEELAELEWKSCVRSFLEDDDGKNGRTTETNEAFVFRRPARLELVRFPFPPSGPPQSSFRPGDDGASCDVAAADEICVLASYPRSGNTLLRSLLERITGVVTGSDTRPDRTLSRSLAIDHGMVGEGVVDPRVQTGDVVSERRRIRRRHRERTTTAAAGENRVVGTAEGGPSPSNEPSRLLPYVVKTHHPERKGNVPYRASSAILLVRNPYDAIDSYWNLCCTNSHSKTVSDVVYERYGDKFEGLARNEFDTWRNFHRWWLDRNEVDGLPVLLVRYEDLVLRTEREMARVMRFLTRRSVGEGGAGTTRSRGASTMTTATLDAFWRERIRHALRTGSDEEEGRGASGGDGDGDGRGTLHLGSYRPRGGSSKNGNTGGAGGTFASIGKSLRRGRYSEETLRFAHDRAESSASSSGDNLLRRFGYDVCAQGFPNNFRIAAAEEEEEYDGDDHEGGSVGGNATTSSADDAASEDGEGARTPCVVFVRMNVASEIVRDERDPYGRAMTAWRKGETDDDRMPFPTTE